ncbi:MAG: hypothetical protein ACRC5B_05505 [Fusobacteriaceae bacterium]
MTTMTMRAATMNINLIIESSDILEEKSTERVLALKKIENNSTYYAYESGMGRCEFLISADSLKMKRTGEADLELEIYADGEGKMKYSTMGFQKDFRIKNAHISFSSGNIAFSYDIMEGNELINTLTIKIWEEQ